MKKTLAGAAVLLTAALTLTACGDDAGSSESSGHDMSSMSGSPESPDGGTDSASARNDADVTFAQGMIPHHQQAVEMAKMATDRAASAEVKDLASKIEAAQAPEIEMLTSWLESWGEEVPSDSMEEDDMSGMDHGSGEMAGMMDQDDMAKLEKASGAEFDRMFLQMMIEHHTGAVEMAQTEVDNGGNTDAITMAERINTTQRAEIDQMKQLLQQS